jgi:hypothetical protein
VATHIAASLVVMKALGPRAGAHAGGWPRLLATAVVLIAVGAASLRPTAGRLWRSSRSPAEAAAAIASRIEPAEEEIVVVGEPPIAYYLTMAGRHAFRHVDDLDYVRQATTSFYLVTGLYTGRSRQTRDALSQLGDRMVPVDTFAMTPGDVRLLDDGRAETARAYAVSPDDTYALTLYRVLPASQVAPR